MILRDVIKSDLPVLFEQQQDSDATRMAAFPARDNDTFMAHWTKILDDKAVEKKTILFDGQVAGNIVSFEQSGQPLVGFWIGKAFWGKGIATKALSKFLEHIKVRPLYAFVAKHNVASKRVLEKCGFTICGEKPEEFVLKLSAGDGTEGQQQVTCRPHSATVSPRRWASTPARPGLTVR